jgi:3',5'-cyclic AMP phosphodiesterase CpdA
VSRDTGRITVLHLSDVHATESGLLYDAVDGLGRLERVGDYARAAGMTPEAVIITGDLVQRGNPGAYEAVAVACRRLEDAVGAPVLTVLGNHDDPIAARSLPGHGKRHFGERTVDGFRIVRLDSAAGSLDAEQLDWLATVLSTPAERGTIVALHHAPLGSPMPALSRQGLADADALLGVLAGSDTRAILAGHFHHALTASVRGIPVFVGPSLAYHQVMDAGPHAVAGHDSPMFSLVQFTRDGVSSAAIPLHSPDPLFTQPITRTPQKATHVS